MASVQQYICIDLQHPITHITWDKGRYTSYEIDLRTTNPAFEVRSSRVRRRYSEFVWLRKKLMSHHRSKKPPELPPKHYCSGRFDKDFIAKRKQLLEQWLRKIVTEVVYLSDNCLHLFLQSPLSTDEIEECIQGKSKLTATAYILKHAGPKVLDDDALSDDDDINSWVDIDNDDLLSMTPETSSVNSAVGPSIVHTIVDIEASSGTFVSHALVGQRRSIPRVRSAPAFLVEKEDSTSPRSILGLQPQHASETLSPMSRERRKTVQFSPTVQVNEI